MKLLQLDVTKDVEVQQAYEFISKQVANEGKLLTRRETMADPMVPLPPTVPSTHTCRPHVHTHDAHSTFVASFNLRGYKVLN